MVYTVGSWSQTGISTGGIQKGRGGRTGGGTKRETGASEGGRMQRLFEREDVERDDKMLGDERRATRW
jgi:hypothetical protein